MSSLYYSWILFDIIISILNFQNILSLIYEMKYMYLASYRIISIKGVL